MEYMDYYHTEYKFIDSDKLGYKELVFDDISEWFEGYFKKYPLIYTKVLNSENNLFPIVDEDTNRVSNKKIAMNMSYINPSRARKLLFKIMNERIEGWWE
jgi:hypothetical protein